MIVCCLKLPSKFTSLVSSKAEHDTAYPIPDWCAHLYLSASYMNHGDWTQSLTHMSKRPVFVPVNRDMFTVQHLDNTVDDFRHMCSNL